jgi:hypothetical protein
LLPTHELDPLPTSRSHFALVRRAPSQKSVQNRA